MDTQTHIEEKAEEQGWSKTTIIALLSEFIDQQNDHTAFCKFIEDHIQWENEVSKGLSYDRND